MAKLGRVEKSLEGLRALALALATLRAGHVDVGFFAGDADRNPEKKGAAAARAKRRGEYIGEGSKPGYFKQGVDFAKKRASLKAHPEDANLTNPEIAAKSEFGVGVPRRSMLRMPLHVKGDEIVKKSRDDARAQLKDVARNPQKVAKKVLARLGIEAEGVIQDAFDTRGFGSWAPNAPATIALKGSDSPLIDTAQLRHAVDSRVVV